MYNPVEYFDEMNILKDDKLRRKKTAKEFINALVDFFAAQFLNLISGIFLYEKTSADYENELMDLYFAMMPEYQYETEVRDTDFQSIFRKLQRGQWQMPTATMIIKCLA